MREAATRRYDGGRQRCVECGHPRKEHAGPKACSVPKCACPDYADKAAAVTPPAQPATPA